MRRKVILIITIILFVFSLICLLKTEKIKREINKSRIEFTYSESDDGTVSLRALGGRKINMRFGERSVRIEKSYREKDTAEQTYVIMFILYFAKSKGIEIQNDFTDMLGELRLHNFLYGIGYRNENTADADLDYNGDGRWYVNLFSKLF